jgi:hypothetical protein
MTAFAALDSRLKFRNSTVLLKLAACCILHFRPAGGVSRATGPKPRPPCSAAMRVCAEPVSAQSSVLGTQNMICDEADWGITE